MTAANCLLPHRLIVCALVACSAGGKDSLVTLDMAADRGFSTHLLYVIDDVSYFDTDWRLQGIIGLLSDATPLHTGAH